MAASSARKQPLQERFVHAGYSSGKRFLGVAEVLCFLEVAGGVGELGCRPSNLAEHICVRFQGTIQSNASNGRRSVGLPSEVYSLDAEVRRAHQQGS